MALIHNTNSIVTQNLVLCLDAANTKSYSGSGATTWSDLSGNGNTGTLVNTPTYNAANGGSLVFNGSSQYVNIGTQSLIGSGTAPFAAEIWFYNTKNFTAGQYTTLVTLKQDSEFFINIYPSGATLYAYPTFRGQTQWATPVTQSDYVNKWICMALVYNGGNKSTASSYITYANGVQLSTGSVNFGAAGGSTNSNSIGSDGASPNLQGNISAYKVYNRALSTAEITQNFNALRSRYGI